ncbi:esterase-like activity of phytase family protein [Phenylobacterium sp.]|uniref:esterase-like activity of phytase family protein n=1 Tax=Phenylobacterium sp. TaxID=1871053 RepID=UPI0025EE32E9|nr:esterase-like activity of phytase family protein [Phenylobacterium sp.]MBX3482371.1 esterase-like activity of phytase family protein [Phenylobacterium sp.]
MRAAAGLLAALLLLAGCVAPVAPLPVSPVPVGAAIQVDAEAVPLDPTNPSRERIGNFLYAGGVSITSRQTSRLHGMSDLKVTPDGRLLAMGDQSDMLEAQVVLDGAGRLTGLAAATLVSLKDPKGVDLFAGGPREYDAEGVARLATGDLLVSFEQHDRVLVFPAGGGPPRGAPKPDIRYTDNKGMEALVDAPDVAPDAYRVGLEDSGHTYLCRLSAACVRDRDLPLDGSELVAMDNVPGGGLAYLLRSFSPLRGNVIKLKVLDRAGRLVDEMEITRPLTVDNLEGLAAVPRPDGAIRFYLIADDNFGFYDGKPTGQRTLLLAFDWRPQGKR